MGRALGWPFVDIAALLAFWIEKRGLSAAELARRVDVKPPFVFAAKAMKVKIPIKRAEAWADALELSGDDRKAFILAVHLAKATSQVREYVQVLEARVAASQKLMK